MVSGKYDAFARKLLRGVAKTVLHEILYNFTVCILIVDLLIDLLLLEVEKFGIISAFFKLLALLLGHVPVLDAITQEFGCMRE
ncbi:hypothetical protein DSECCO2_555150 [anaerobic digester metagenome]